MHYRQSRRNLGRKIPGQDRKKAPPKRKKKQIPQKSKTGLKGQEIVQRLLPQLKFINKPGADFLYRSREGLPFLFEVKTTFNEQIIEGKRIPNLILLKTRNGAWVNQKAHYVLFVTKGKIYFGKASDIRAFVKFNFESLQKHKQSSNGITPTLVSVEELAKKHLLFECPSFEPKIVQTVFKEFMRLERLREMQQRSERQQFMRRFEKQPANPKPALRQPVQKSSIIRNHVRIPLPRGSRRGK